MEPTAWAPVDGPRPSAEETLRAIDAVVTQARKAGSNLDAQTAMGEIARILQASSRLSPHLSWTEAQTALFFAEG